MQSDVDDTSPELQRHNPATLTEASGVQSTHGGDRGNATRAPSRKRKGGEHKGYSLVTRPDGRKWFRVRRQDLKPHSHIFAKDTARGDIIQYIEDKMEELKNAKKGLPTKAFQEITLEVLLNQALKNPVCIKFNKNDTTNIKAFIKRAKLCKKRLYQIEWRDIQRYVNERLTSGEVNPYTITRTLVPIIRVYDNAARTDLFGLIADFAGDVPNPFASRELKLPLDTSGRKRVLQYDQDKQIYDAILKHCRSYLRRRRMIALVRLAISTALRRGVLLQLKWSDIKFDKKIIDIDSRYWTKMKPAPDMVPISAKMEKELKQFFDCIPEQERKPSCKLFPNPQELEQMHGVGRKIVDDNTKWCDETWRGIIRLTDLWIPVLDQDEKPIIGEDGEPIKDWFHFHDLRHTATTRYAEEDTYDLGSKQYNYLLAKGERYNHPDSIKMCNTIRTKIDKGDNITFERLEHRDLVITASWGGSIISDKIPPEDEALWKTLAEPDVENKKKINPTEEEAITAKMKFGLEYFKSK